ncbi:2OG-Fe(II) oxygenase [Dokdonella sp.]|uniref:2OG-Fe(II) oxygenase n=1 Tax=Dokdonella sp. TaxID=2291710 RepID=UPI002617F02B|nr:2OG-Fe(II) oxygenase [Dokdonella sp.]
MLNPRVLQERAQLRERFVNAEPFRYLVVDDFLEEGFARRLLGEFPPFEKGNSASDDGRPGGKSTVERIRGLGPCYAELDATIQTRGFLDLVGELTGIADLLYDPFYLGGGTHENRHGQMLQAHIDFNYHPSERWHRRLNLIVYLNPRWEAAWGGNLELYRDPYTDTRPAASIVPAFNRCVIFETTEDSWHGFDKIELPAECRDLSRRSVALYFYTRDRPADETAGKHTTHYVNRQLGEHFRPGYVLSEGDVAELRELIAHRDNQLKSLYEENARLLQAQEAGAWGRLTYLLKRFYVRYKR